MPRTGGTEAVGGRRGQGRKDGLGGQGGQGKGRTRK